MNASSAKKNVLLLFKGEKISFSDVGKIIYYLSHLVLTFAQNAGGGGQGPTPGMLRGCIIAPPPPVYTIMALQGKDCRSMYPPLGAIGGIIQSLFTMLRNVIWWM